MREEQCEVGAERQRHVTVYEDQVGSTPIHFARTCRGVAKHGLKRSALTRQIESSNLFYGMGLRSFTGRLWPVVGCQFHLDSKRWALWPRETGPNAAKQPIVVSVRAHVGAVRDRG